MFASYRECLQSSYPCSPFDMLEVSLKHRVYPMRLFSQDAAMQLLKTTRKDRTIPFLVLEVPSLKHLMLGEAPGV